MKTVKADELISESSGFRRILLEDIDEIEAESSIVVESVYRNEWFQDFFDDILGERRRMYHKSDLMKLFSGCPKVKKILEKHWKNLYVERLDFSDTEFLESLEYFSGGKISQAKLIEKAITLSAKARFSNGITVTFGDYPNFIIIYLNSRANEPLQRYALKHEFIHYLENISGKNKNVKLANMDFYAEELKTLRNHGIDAYADNIEYVTRSDEYFTLMNDLLSTLKKVKDKWYRDLDGNSFTKKMVDLLFKKDGETNDNYLSRVSKLVCFSMLKSRPEFLMLLFYNMIGEKQQNIKNHIYGDFNGK